MFEYHIFFIGEGHKDGGK